MTQDTNPTGGGSDTGPGSTADGERDLARHERPDMGLVPDEALPDDLRPTDDNPLAQDPDQRSDTGADAGAGGSAEGMPDLGSPGGQA